MIERIRKLFGCRQYAARKFAETHISPDKFQRNFSQPVTQGAAHTAAYLFGRNIEDAE